MRAFGAGESGYPRVYPRMRSFGAGESGYPRVYPRMWSYGVGESGYPRVYPRMRFFGAGESGYPRVYPRIGSFGCERIWLSQGAGETGHPMVSEDAVFRCGRDWSSQGVQGSGETDHSRVSEVCSEFKLPLTEFDYLCGSDSFLFWPQSQKRTVELRNIHLENKQWETALQNGGLQNFCVDRASPVERVGPNRARYLRSNLK